MTVSEWWNGGMMEWWGKPVASEQEIFGKMMKSRDSTARTQRFKVKGTFFPIGNWMNQNELSVSKLNLTQDPKDGEHP